jgi:endonuclease/exonuclease/phosphatase (EEP) superfamily protein YafD
MDPTAERAVEAGRGDAVSNLETVRTPSQNSAESSAAAEEWKTTFRPLFAVSFCGACLGVLALLIMFHAPAVNVPIFFFTTRPAMVWFGMLLPFLIVGALGVRRRWFVLGCAFWIVSLLACEDALAWVRPFHESARTKFEASQMAYLSFSKTHGNDIKILDVPLRIVSWNMDAGRMGAAQAVTQLASLRPDLALLEEFAWGEHAAMFDAFHASPYFREYHLACTGSIAIISRFPITEAKEIPLPWNSAVWQVHFAPDRRITCVVLHLSSPDLKTQLLRGWTVAGLRKALDARRSQLEKVRERLGLQADGSPILLTGDFNVPSNYPDLSIATAGMKDAFATKGYGWGKTAGMRWIERVARPDMIFVPSDATVFDAFAAPTTHSDHCPVIAEISIPVPRLEPVELPPAKQDVPAAPEPLVPKKRTWKPKQP